MNDIIFTLIIIIALNAVLSLAVIAHAAWKKFRAYWWIVKRNQQRWR